MLNDVAMRVNKKDDGIDGISEETIELAIEGGIADWAATPTPELATELASEKDAYDAQ